MILGMGIDMVDLDEFRGRLNDDLIAELFLPDEIRYCRTQVRSWENFAGRFAAKEAAFKALGEGLEQGLRFRHVEIRRKESGRISLEFHERAAERAAQLGVQRAFVSISHSRSNAIAIVIVEGETP